MIPRAAFEIVILLPEARTRTQSFIRITRKKWTNFSLSWYSRMKTRIIKTADCMAEVGRIPSLRKAAV
jgi:hypothetical protein